jgi:hypothetical protein
MKTSPFVVGIELSSKSKYTGKSYLPLHVPRKYSAIAVCAAFLSSSDEQYCSCAASMN